MEKSVGIDSLSLQKIEFPPLYLGPIDYYQIWVRTKERPQINILQKYHRQHLTTRCQILSPMGVQSLSIPIEKENGGGKILCDVRIANQESWQHVHWEAIKTAYGKSAFFSILADVLEYHYVHKYKYLIDFTLSLHEEVAQILNDVIPDLSLPLQRHNIHVENPSTFFNVKNGREIPSVPFISSKRYFQVFSNKFGFTPHLSIIDLLFNTGHDIPLYL